MTLYDIFSYYCSNFISNDSDFIYTLKVVDKLLGTIRKADFTDEKSFYDTIYQIEQWKQTYQHLFEDDE